MIKPKHELKTKITIKKYESYIKNVEFNHFLNADKDFELIRVFLQDLQNASYILFMFFFNFC